MDKNEQYRLALAQIEALVEAESDPVANLANICAVLKENFQWHWVGFYRADEVSGSLVLAPFQGPPACMRIPFSRGICGRAYTQKRTIVIDDVHADAAHIACSALSESEIVIPVFCAGHVRYVLDIDADKPAAFDDTDASWLERIAQIASRAIGCPAVGKTV